MTTSGTADDTTARSAPVPAALVLGLAGAVFVAARLVGISSRVGRLSLGAPPLVGSWEIGGLTRIWIPLSVGAVLVALLPLAADRLPWRSLLISAWVGSGLFTLSLALVDGSDAVAEPLATGFEYRAVLGDIDRLGVRTFVDRFTTDLPTYPVHVRGHPVGATLAFWVPEQLGLRGAEWTAALMIVAGTSVVVSTAVVVRSLAGEAIARRALPFLAVPPALVWVATSADALIAGVVAAAVALTACASSRHGFHGAVSAITAGAAAALALHLSYGAVLMLLPALAIVGYRRRADTLAFAAVGAAAVTAAFVGLGFWWFDGLAATRAEYVLGAGGYRPYWYFALLGNPAAFAVALGPAVLVAVARLRDRRLWLLVGAASAGVVLADVSGMSKGEVERIWLAFVPFLVAATAVLPIATRRLWLAAQVGLAVVVQLALESPW